MPKNYRPTEAAAFSSDAERAGRALCEEVLGIEYAPPAARYYATAIKRRDQDQLTRKHWQYIAFWGLAYVDELVSQILD